MKVSKLSILKEFGIFLKAKKKYWLMPIIILLVLLAILIVVSESSALSPFIYTLF